MRAAILKERQSADVQCLACRAIVRLKGFHVHLSAHQRPNGHRYNAEGYVDVLDPQTLQRKREHIVVAERAFGGPLPAGVIVHHHDEDKSNNANANLVICQDRAYHNLLHVRMRILAAGGDPDTQKICDDCLGVLGRDEFGFDSGASDGLMRLCRPCKRASDKAFYLSKTQTPPYRDRRRKPETQIAEGMAAVERLVQSVEVADGITA